MSTQTESTFAHRLGFALTRVIVPLWVLAGAVFKLVEANPANLPKGIWRPATNVQLDLDWLLASLISIEIVLAAIMLFIAKLARPAAIFVLSVFCLVLLNEIRIGNFTSCGCLGKIPIKPWQMLTIDGLLLLGVLATGIVAPMRGATWKLGPIAAAILAVVGVGATVMRIIPDRRSADPIVANRNVDAPPLADGGHVPVADGGQTSTPEIVEPTPVRPPRNYVTPDDKSVWVGKKWREIDLLQFLPQPPKNIDSGTRYIVFYSRSCEHCEAMFWDDLIMDIGAEVTAVEMPGAQTWDMPQTKCELMSLPTGTNWIITPPLALKVVDGIVTCATEGDHKKCLGLR